MIRAIQISTTVAAIVLCCSATVAAQTSTPDDRLATPAGQEVSINLGGYKYVEPGTLAISIHGPKFGGDYTGTAPLDQSRHWFVQANARGFMGNVTYTGWCSPWLVTPNSASPNGYELGVGDASPCTESGDRDWYVEGRGLVGKDFVGGAFALSPATGLGVRHLSNGTTGIAGFRTDNYLYVPIAVTARTAVATHRVLSVTLEYDRLIRGWQKTRDSALGGGFVPATATAPEFTIDGFSDVSFAQHGGWALRASAKYQATRRLSVEPYYIRWDVRDSTPNNELVVFTVNTISVQEQLGFYEPRNFTNEFGVKLGLRFK